MEVDFLKMPKVFACFIKNKRIHNLSSSGGIFYSIASAIINDYHGVVFGVVVDDNGLVYHKKASSLSDLLPMLGSKYVMSSLNNTFTECKDILLNNQYVLFSGTPCQINSLHFYLDRENINKEKLISVDVICHGTPKQEWWNKYLELNFYGKELTGISFRHKVSKWDWNVFKKTTSSLNIKIGNYIASFSEDPYIQAFLQNKILHESCYKCRCKGENRKSDITLGDFWGGSNVSKKFINKNGTSLVILRSNKSLLLHILKKYCVCHEVPFVDSLYPANSSYYMSVKKPLETISEHDLLIKNVKKDNEKPHFVKNKVWDIYSKICFRTKGVYNNKAKRVKNGKVAIITEYGYNNYGNRLQNYALLYLLRKNGKQTFNVAYSEKDPTFIHSILSVLRGHFNNNEIMKRAKKEIIHASKQYEGKTIFFSKTKRKQKWLCGIETVIVGSDQVWNCGYHTYKNDLEFSLGNFGIINRPFKLVSYAPSICVNGFNENQRFIFAESLLRFDMVSTREPDSTKLLESIGINSVNVLDPTLLLTSFEWDSALAKYTSMVVPNYSYVFLYLLSDKNPIIDEGIQIVNCLDNESIFYCSNHFDFVNLIKNSEKVITDSFHALVFSLIYRKKVILIKRDLLSMESRIKTIFDLLKLPLKYEHEYDFSNINLDGVKSQVSSSLSYFNLMIK